MSMRESKILKCVLIFVLIMNLLVPPALSAAPNPVVVTSLDGSKGFKDGQLLLKVKGGAQEEKRILKKYRLNFIQRLPRTEYVLASFNNQNDNKNFADIIRKLQQEDSVARAQPNYIYRTFGLPNDPQFKRQWALNSVNGNKTWSTAPTGSGAKPVIVAVLDTGVDVNHPDLRTRLVSGINMLNPLKSSRDSDGHGTHIAGIISALTNNKTGIAGVAGMAPVKVMPVKVFDGNEGSDVSISNGIIWAVDHGARVINMSFGSYSKSEVLNEAIDYAYKKGVVLVAAAGNWASEEVSYPAAVSRVIAVSAIDNKNNISEFSSYGPLIDICAPGEDIYSTFWDPYKGSTYTEMSGTSMASPMVAGLAALLLTKNPKLTNDEIRQIIEVSATDLGDSGWDTKYGHGKINVDKAMTISLSRIDDSNSSADKAVSLTSGVPVQEKIHFGSDQDWFKINVPQSGHLQVEVLPAGKVSPGVEIYDKNGKLLASFNSDLNPVQYKVAEAVHGLVTDLMEGDYYIKVFGNHFRWSEREYTVTAWAIPRSDLIKDVNEPNNSYETARKIPIGIQVSGTISSQWDQDWYKIELPGKIYTVRAKTPEGLDLAVEIESVANYDESDGEFNDYTDWFYQSINNTGIGGSEEGVIVLPKSRQRNYFIKVYDIGGGSFNGSYTVIVSPYDLKPDSFEPNNNSNSAVSLDLGQRVIGNFDTTTDIDWYSVDISDTGILKVNFRRPDNIWCDINIYNENMELIGNNSTGFSREFGTGSGLSNIIESEFKVFPGKYYIEVNSSIKKISGSYELECGFSSFQFIDEEINDTRSGAVALALGEVKSGTIYPLADIDGYVINLEKTEPLIITLTPDKELDTSAVILSEQASNPAESEKAPVSNNLTNSSDSDASEIEVVTIINGGGKGQTDTGVFQPSKPGRYFLVVGGSGKAGSKYSVSIRPFKVKPDKWEDNSTLKKARPLKAGSSITPTLMGTEDVDWYKLYLPGAGVFSADLTVPPDIDGVLEIYDSSGKLLAKSDQSMVGEKEYASVSIRSPGYYFIKTFDYLGNSSVQAYNLTTRFTAAKS